ncbi:MULTISPECIES: SusC/RagA family TonB-linked outer membrane protein [Chryseobacterium]|jgi:TonB-linked SusC/RagA family outer membrane protein|uniref:SusC/RagA family TonB-linked outer membrane protein n=2 Tax=Chryseobacterium nepalense TaxID=1854498 RepID=A0ABY4K609_9FLAO|nr:MULTISPECIES: SusC/RagA family TonB-linked outer membrane protein [Chryseobacterium]MEA1848713.1 SusC/RagA family TonB-linked outer membrane protein [Chryseobacterium sp. MHB01]UPQ76197.1 SusC/RagA family TonB-linked outer membrane protein [Chryseobacterium nepalense]
MNRFYLAKTNKAALFFAMALLPSGFAYAQVKKDSVTKERKIDEVVVIGYGTQRKEAVTGSVATVKGDVLREVPSANITQALQGRTAGVDISQTSTKPGAAMQIRIRGTRSLTGDNNPLIVLDGIPFVGSLSDISSSDIKSIDILKDASATAIYGSRGANGVILVTTNRGSKGQKPRFTYNSFTGVQTLFSKYPMMDGPKFAQLRAYATPAGNTTPLYTNGADENNNNNTDWQSLYYKPAMMTSHDVGVSGGTEGGNYNVGLSYFKQDALIPLQSYERFSLRTAIDQQVGKSFKFGFTTNTNYSVSEGNGVNPGAVLGYSPLADPYNADGTFKRVMSTAGGIDQTWIYTRKTLEGLNDKYVDETKSFASYNNLYGEVSLPLNGLKYRLNVGLDFRTANNGNYTGVGVFNTNPLGPSSAGRGNNQTYHWVVENLLTYDRTFGKHKVNAVGLYSAEGNRFTSSYMSAKNVPADFFQYYNLGQSPQADITVRPEDQRYEQTGLLSAMGRVMYTYDNKYMLTATLRADGSSRLAPGNKWHTYPALSLGWNITNESFMQNIKALNLFKLRAGWGQTSNQAVAPYSTLGSLTVTPYNFGGSNGTGVYVNQAPNADLGWEYSKTQNYGADFGLFNNRITGSIEYYRTHTYDLLSNKSLPPSSGLSFVTKNVAETENKGWEFSLNGTILDNPDGFSLDAGVNFYTNRNKILALASGIDRDVNNLWFVGHNINSLYDYQYIGLWQAGDPYQNILEPGTAADVVGSIKVLYTGGYNADGTPVRAIGPDDRQIFDTAPKYQGGFNIRLAYKNFELSTVGAFQHGGILISTLYGSASYLNRLTGRGNNVDVDYWTENNTEAYFPRPGRHLSGDNPKYSSTLAMFDASYLKLRTITLGYNIDKDFLKDLKITSFRIYVTVTNPLVLFSPYHKFSGMDPEPNSFGNENQAVSGYQSRQLIIGTNNPSTRNYLMGLNLTF